MQIIRGTKLYVHSIVDDGQYANKKSFMPLDLTEKCVDWDVEP